MWNFIGTRGPRLLDTTRLTHGPFEMYHPETLGENEEDAMQLIPHNNIWAKNEQTQNSQYLPSMTSLIDERFLGPVLVTGEASGSLGTKFVPFLDAPKPSYYPRICLSAAQITALANTNPAVPHSPPPTRFKVSQGDAVLLNIMDCQRTSADEWMDLLQKQGGGDGSGTSTDADGEVSEYDDASESESADDMWRSEDEDENPMVTHMLSRRSGTPVRR
ncbi:uncharacterized protein B0H64DRAFT_430493 [Chaetomium fimeti]|uniref:Uncharacterized protein n=1 Tax=Chaetomium fimeti TaxID=1854472 RepID=A0AAE0LVX3_9PEZI|nr:hypothetical protein B0H64DRAFT_430493 [Chaetomium fimeti]